MERLASLRGSADYWPVFDTARKELHGELRLHVSANGWGHYPDGKGRLVWMPHAEGRKVAAAWSDRQRFLADCEGAVA